MGKGRKKKVLSEEEQIAEYQRQAEAEARAEVEGHGIHNLFRLIEFVSTSRGGEKARRAKNVGLVILPC
jgi:hypothetical protein